MVRDRGLLHPLFSAIVASTTDTTLPGEPTDYCPLFQHSIELIGRRWTGSILKVLGDRALRFGEIRSEIPGLSDRLLNTRLTELEAEHIVSRTQSHGDVRYSATAKGMDLWPVLDALSLWVAEHSGSDCVADRPGRRRGC